MFSKNIELVTTTSNIEGWKIQKYLGVVSYQLVIGANIFRDVFASFRDIFGGSAKGYQKDLNEMKKIALQNIEKETVKKGGNVIIGLNVDFDEVSGGGKSMFMLSVIGTAAVAKKHEQDKLIDNENISIVNQVSSEELNFKIKFDEMTKKYKTNSIQSIEDIEVLINYKIELFDKIIDFIESHSYSIKEHLNILTEYFSIFQHKKISEFLMKRKFSNMGYESTKETLLKILNNIGWYDFDIINKLLLDDDIKCRVNALYLVEIDKKYYQKEDLKNLYDLLKNLEEYKLSYPVYTVTKGSFGKEKQVWECLNCKKQNSEKYSNCEYCGNQNYGIPSKYDDLEKIKSTISLKIQTLVKLLK